MSKQVAAAATSSTSNVAATLDKQLDHKRCMDKILAKIANAHTEIATRSPGLLYRCNVLLATHMTTTFTDMLNKAQSQDESLKDKIGKIKRGIANLCGRLLAPDLQTDNPADVLHYYLLVIKELFTNVSPDDAAAMRQKNYPDCIHRFVMLESQNIRYFTGLRFRQWVGHLTEEDRTVLFNSMRVWAVFAAVLAFVPKRQLVLLEKLMACQGDPERQRDMDLRVFETAYCLTLLFDSVSMDNVFACIQSILELWVKDPERRVQLKHECADKLRPFLRQYWDQYVELSERTMALIQTIHEKHNTKTDSLLVMLRDKCIVNILGIHMLVQRMASEYNHNGPYKLTTLDDDKFGILVELSDRLHTIALDMMKHDTKLHWDLLKDIQIVSLGAFFASRVFFMEKTELEGELRTFGDDVRNDWSDIVDDVMLVLKDEVDDQTTSSSSF